MFAFSDKVYALKHLETALKQIFYIFFLNLAIFVLRVNCIKTHGV